MAGPTAQSPGQPHAFPYRQLTILAICRICEPIAFMSIFPYIYYMIESFHITDDERRIALYAGMVTSSFALAEAMSSSLWGRLSDKVGRKPILLFGLFGTGLSMMVFGFAQSLPAVLIARALGGLLNGNIGVLQTTVAEVVKVEAHQGVAFALMPTVWCIGTVIGSALGGSLAEPVRSYPGIFEAGTVFDRYPYLLPNIVCAMVVVMGMTVGVFFLEETHEDMQERRDWGLEIGKWMTGCFRQKSQPRKELLSAKGDYTSESLALLHESEAELPPDYKSAASSPDLQATAAGLPPPYQPIESAHETAPMDRMMIDDGEVEAAAKKRSAGVMDNLSRQLVLNIVGYGILAYHTISAEQLLPVLFSLPESDSQPTLPFWFHGGFALSTKRIGVILSTQGVIQIISTLIIFPFVQRKLGTLLTYRLMVLTYPFLYLLVPYLTLVPVSLRMPAIYAILVWKVTAQAFSFPSNNIMLANATPKRALGTFNGIAQSAASLARALGPTISGLLQAAGLTQGVLGLPWWFNALVATAGAIISLCMAEQKRAPVESEKTESSQTDELAPVPSPISPNAALVASADGLGSNPTSPLLPRGSADMYGRQRDSKANIFA